MAKTVTEYKRKLMLAQELHSQCKERVMNWLDDNFEPDALMKIEDAPYLPGGTLVTDRHGEPMLIWYEPWHEAIKFSFSAGK